MARGSCPALQVRGPHVVSHYFNSDAPAADREGWFDTGWRAVIRKESRGVWAGCGQWLAAVRLRCSV